MSAELIVLLIVIVTALAFDFTNGFHDTANAMATSIATGALGPRTAVAMSGVLNLVGAFLSVEVAKTVSGGLLNISNVHHMALLQIVFAGLVGGILWNLLTWLFGIPSSSTHALFGGLIGAAMAALGASGVIWTGNQSTGLINKIIVPALLAPIVAGIVACLGTFLIYRLTRASDETKVRKSFRVGQIGSAALVSLAHGTESCMSPRISSATASAYNCSGRRRDETARVRRLAVPLRLRETLRGTTITAELPSRACPRAAERRPSGAIRAPDRQNW